MSGLNHPECQCEPGWTGVECGTPTQPSTLTQGSYMRVALSFTPPPTALTLQARVRGSGAASGVLVRVTAQHHAAAFTLHVSRRTAAVVVVVVVVVIVLRECRG